jgi:hypothetical protein
MLDNLGVNPCDLVILDSDLADIPFVQAGQLLLEAYPDLYIMVIPPNDDPDHLSLVNFTPHAYLKRPFYMPDLLEKLDLLLGYRPLSLQDLSPAAPRGTPPRLPAWVLEVETASRRLSQNLFGVMAHAAMIFDSERLLAFAGELSPVDAGNLFQSLADAWSAGQKSDLVRFIRLSGRGGEFQLYARILADPLVVALLFEYGMPLSHARTNMGRFMRALVEKLPTPELAESAVQKPMPAQKLQTLDTADPFAIPPIAWGEPSHAVDGPRPATSELELLEPEPGEDEEEELVEPAPSPEDVHQAVLKTVNYLENIPPQSEELDSLFGPVTPAQAVPQTLAQAGLEEPVLDADELTWMDRVEDEDDFASSALDLTGLLAEMPSPDPEQKNPRSASREEVARILAQEWNAGESSEADEAISAEDLVVFPWEAARPAPQAPAAPVEVPESVELALEKPAEPAAETAAEMPAAGVEIPTPVSLQAWNPVELAGEPPEMTAAGESTPQAMAVGTRILPPLPDEMPVDALAAPARTETPLGESGETAAREDTQPAGEPEDLAPAGDIAPVDVEVPSTEISSIEAADGEPAVEGPAADGTASETSETPALEAAPMVQEAPAGLPAWLETFLAQRGASLADQDAPEPENTPQAPPDGSTLDAEADAADELPAWAQGLLEQDGGTSEMVSGAQNEPPVFRPTSNPDEDTKPIVLRKPATAPQPPVPASPEPADEPSFELYQDSQPPVQAESQAADSVESFLPGDFPAEWMGTQEPSSEPAGEALEQALPQRLELDGSDLFNEPERVDEPEGVDQPETPGQSQDFGVSDWLKELDRPSEARQLDQPTLAQESEGLEEQETFEQPGRLELPDWARNLLNTSDQPEAEGEATPENAQAAFTETPGTPSMPVTSSSDEWKKFLAEVDAEAKPEADSGTKRTPSDAIADLSNVFYFAEGEPAESAAGSPFSDVLASALEPSAPAQGPETTPAEPLPGSPAQPGTVSPFSADIDAPAASESVQPQASTPRPFLFDDLASDAPVIPSPEHLREEAAVPTAAFLDGSSDANGSAVESEGDLVLPWEQEGNLDWLANEADTTPVTVKPSVPAANQNAPVGMEASPIGDTRRVVVHAATAQGKPAPSVFLPETSESPKTRPFEPGDLGTGEFASENLGVGDLAIGVEIPAEESNPGAPRTVAPFYEPGDVAPPPEGSVAYTCILIPRHDHHLLVGDLGDRLKEWVPQNCLAFGWYLEKVNVNSSHLQWTVMVTPTVSPGNLVRIIRQRTSDLIFQHFPYLREAGESDFWAPGSLALRGTEPPSEQNLQDFIEQTRHRQAGS